MPPFKVTMSQSRILTKVIEAPSSADLSDLLTADTKELCEANGWDIDPYSVEEAVTKIEPLNEEAL